MPSKRVIWTALGNKDEHWIDPELNYCTCNDYFFRTLSGKGPCYHLTSAAEQIQLEKYEKVVLRDEEYGIFISSMIGGYFSKLKISTVL
jgi:predicted nucleic acid-binding Zn finger protein